MSEQDDNFLSRWSRRKAQVRQGVPPPAAGPAVVVPFPVPAASPVLPPRQAEAAVGAAVPVALTPSGVAADVPVGVSQQPAPASVPAPPKPTLEDVEALTPESDFSRFIARDVDEKVKNSAMKKLFSDPHYNVMDGLDTYIADYNTPDPLPKAMLRQLVQARMLGLLDDELPEQPAPEEGAQAAATPDVAPGADAAAELPAEQAAAEVATQGGAEPATEAVKDGGAAPACTGPMAVEGAAQAAVATTAAPVAIAEVQPAAGSASSAS